MVLLNSYVGLPEGMASCNLVCIQVYLIISDSNVRDRVGRGMGMGSNDLVY